MIMSSNLDSSDKTAAYYKAFSHFLNTGNSEHLSEYIEGEHNPAILSVYRNGYYKASVEALAANYPITQQLLSEDLFQKIAKRYVELNPPTGGTLVGYGEQFPVWLEQAPELKTLNLPPLLADIAKLDAGWLNCLNSEDNVSPLTATQVMAMTEQDIDPGTCETSFSQSIQICHTEFNSFDFWQRVKLEGQVPKQFELTKRNETIMFWRLEGQVHGKALTEIEQDFFGTPRGETFKLGERLESPLARFPDADITDLFSQCLQQQLLVLNEPNIA